MLRSLWLLFTQAVTVGLAVLFTLTVLRPEWLPTKLREPAVPARVEAPSRPTGQPVPPVSDDASILSYAGAANRAIPSVVNVLTNQNDAEGQTGNPLFDDPLFRRFFGDEIPRQPQSSLGSGVIIGDGLVVTNHHVVEDSTDIEVLFPDSRKIGAVLVGSDPETDLAVLRLQTEEPVPAIELADVDKARIGDVVLAIGNPFGVGQTVTMGIISALGRSQLGINTFENFIQTDAAINPGNSGGALIDTQGRLLGINTAIYSRSGGSLGIGFAIPASTVSHVTTQLLQSGRVSRGFIGVEPQDITPELADALNLPSEKGAVITALVRGGPAERSGVRVGDVLVAIGDEAVLNIAQMLDIVARQAPGSEVRFHFLREGRELAVDIRIAERPDPPRLPRN
ncbi:MAG: trypsin-like peptidase domain-containing protein [Burkholderiaceae bacterium]